MTSTNLSPKQLNFAHLVLACTDVIKQPLIDILDIYIKPSNLCQKIKQSNDLMSGQHKLNSKQLNKCGFTSPNLPDYSQFDVTLIYALIRNLCPGSLTPTNGWGKEPQVRDTQLGDDIERIRLFRNENVAHANSGKLDETQFQKLWSNLEDVLKRIQSFTGANGYNYDYLQQLANLRGRNVEIDEYTSVIKSLQEEKEAMRKKEISPVPWNVKDQYTIDVEKWREDDHMFLETHNFPAMFEKIKNQPYVTFIGAPGSGKTATARHIALKLQDEEGYEILPISDIEQIETYCDPFNPQVFFIDDVVGMLGLDTNKLDLLDTYKKRITSPALSETKIIMTSRQSIFKNRLLSKSFLSEEMNVVELHSKENSLTDEDKHLLLKKYGLNQQLIPLEILTETSNMFPLLCKMFSNEQFQVDGHTFFISPIPIIKGALEIMQARNTIQYASLVLLMFKKNKLTKSDLQNKNVENSDVLMIEDVLERCKVDSRTPYFELLDALEDMEGTYTQTCGSQFSFIHDSMFEIVAWQFGHQFPELVIKYMSNKYIANYIKIFTKKHTLEKGEKQRRQNIDSNKKWCDNDGKIDLSIYLQESEFPLFAERLFSDLTNGYFITVFTALKNQSVKHTFYEVLKTKQYTELYDAFIVEHVVSDHFFFDELEFWHNCNHFLPAFVKCERNLWYLFSKDMCKNVEHVNALSLVIFCGHHDILELIIDQMKRSNGNLIDLFQHVCKYQRCPEININDIDTTVAGARHDDAKIESSTNRIKLFRLCSHCFPCFKNTDTDINTVNVYDMTSNDKNSDLESESDIETNNKAMAKRQWQLFCLGCYSGDINTVRTLLELVNKTTINMSCHYIENGVYPNPLAIACRFGYSNIAKELIKAGTDVNPNIEAFSAPVLVAADRKDWYIVKEFIKVGADVNQRHQYATLFSDACYQNKLSAVRLLIKAGASINLRLFEKTPLQIAFEKKHMRIVDELIKAGADVDVEENVSLSTTAIHYEKSVNVEKRNSPDIDVNPIQKIASKKYKTPLIGEFSKVKLLIEAGVDMKKGVGHRTPLDVACQDGNLKIIKMLIEAGADVNPINAKMSPLMVACCNGDLKCVQDWIKMGALVNLKTEKETPLITACAEKNISVIVELIKAGADVNLEAGGETPLTSVFGVRHCFLSYCQENIIKIVKILIKAGANVNLKVENKTPLIKACQNRYSYIVDLLIKAGANVNEKAGEKTPLISVLETYNEKHFCAVEVLVQAGADFNQEADDKTPLTIACEKGYTDVVDLFIRAEADFNLTARDKAQLTNACKEINMNLKEGFKKIRIDICSGLQYKSQRLTDYLCKQLNIADLLGIDADSTNFKDDSNESLALKCLTEHTREDGDFVELRANTSPANLRSFLMKSACEIGHLDLVKELIKVGIDLNLIDGTETPLIIACQRGHVTVIRELIKAGADVNLGARCIYPLTVACKNLQVDAVKELIQAKINVNIEASDETPLTATCQLYNSHVLPTADNTKVISIIEELIKAGVDINTKAGNKTPFMIVCRKGNIHAVQLFLKSGADVNLATENKTPLTASCEKGHLDVIKELLIARANVNQMDAHSTPLTAAIPHNWGNVMQIIDVLIKAGADVNLKDKDNTPLTLVCQKGDMNIIVALINAGANVDLKAWNKRPLTVACTEGHFNVVKYLIQRGACVNLDDGIKTPLEIAYERKFMRIAEYLVNAGASINLMKDVFATIAFAFQMGRINDVRKMIKAGTELNPTNVDKTPLTAACQKGHLTLVKELINAGALVDLMDRFSTPLTTACLWGHLNVVKELINAGASVDKIDKYNTPLTTACIWGHLDIVKELIRAGSNVNLRDVSNTPLTNACYWEELDIVKELIKSGADVNLQDEENTPLTIACLNNRIAIVKELIKAKANVNVEARGNTPLTAACEEGDLCIIEMLLEAGADVNLGVEFETTDTYEDVDEYSIDESDESSLED